MMNLIKISSIACIIALLTVGCDEYAYSTEANNGPNRMCIDGVVYVSFGYGGSAWVNPNTMKYSKCQVINGKLTILE